MGIQALAKGKIATFCGFIIIGVLTGCQKPPDETVLILPKPDFPACEPQKCTTSGANIEVLITSEGAKPTIVQACPGDTVTWRAKDIGAKGAPFLIYFKENGTRPCIDCQVRSQPETKRAEAKDPNVGGQEILKHRIAENAAPGCYDYEIVLTGKRKIFDPRLIIGN